MCIQLSPIQEYETEPSFVAPPPHWRVYKLRLSMGRCWSLSRHSCASLVINGLWLCVLCVFMCYLCCNNLLCGGLQTSCSRTLYLMDVLVFYVIINTMTKSKLGKKGLISSYSCSSAWRTVRTGTEGKNLDREPKWKTIEESILLAHLLWLAQLSFLYHAGLFA